MLALKELAPRRPRLVLAHSDPLYAALIRQIFLRLRWEVHVTASGVEARELAAELAPSLIVLDTGLTDESGWLTCAKLKHAQPELNVVLIADHIGRRGYDFAYYVGATTIVSRRDGLRELVDEARDALITV